MTISLTWEEAQDLLAEECAEALGYHRSQIVWDTGAEVLADDLVQLALVSSIDQRDHHSKLDASAIETRTYTTQGVIQLRLETTAPGRSLTECGKLRRHFAKYETAEQLAAQGLGIMRDPSPLRAVPFESKDGYWVSVHQFELMIDFNTVEADSTPSRYIASRVRVSGTANGTINVPLDVSKP